MGELPSQYHLGVKCKSHRIVIFLTYVYYPWKGKSSYKSNISHMLSMENLQWSSQSKLGLLEYVFIFDSF